MQNYNIEVDLLDSDQTRYLEESTATNEVVDLGCASMVLSYESDQNSPLIGDYQNSPFICSKGDSQSRRKGYCPLKGNTDWGDRPGTMGDPLAEHATFILQQGSYPGDTLTRHRDPERFCVYRTTEDRYVILDCKHRLPVDLCVPGRHLREPDFALDCWYARQLGELYGYSPRQV